MAIGNAFADSYFTIGENDTLLVYPNQMANSYLVQVKADFNGRTDEWNMTFSFPTGMQAYSISAGDDMSIPYYNHNGESLIYIAPLTINWQHTEVSTKIWDFGYWDVDGDGQYDPYGTIKWESGEYDDMIDITVLFDPGFTGGTLYLAGNIMSTSDYRQYLIDPNPTAFSRTITVIVGYRPGDVNGDGVLNSADVTAMIAYILGNITDWDQYQIAAADLNGDGYVNVTDVNILNDMILYA